LTRDLYLASVVKNYVSNTEFSSSFFQSDITKELGYSSTSFSSSSSELSMNDITL